MNNDEVSLTVTEFLDMPVRRVSDLLCVELTERIKEGKAPIVGASIEGTNPCDGSRVTLTVTLAQKMGEED